jgi:NAD-dependent deacetylase
MSSWQIPSTLVERVKKAERVTVLTGAGVSAESKIPTFRDAQTGLWSKYRPEELATPEAFQRDPKMVWEWYQWRRELVNEAHPNPGHHALVVMQEKIPIFSLITQNVDGLHQRAGSTNVIELHGNINRTKCWKDGTVVKEYSETDQVPPPCPRCGAYLRPDVVWFGESLPPEAVTRATQASVMGEIFFSVGTSALVYPAAGFVYHAMQQGAYTVEINPDATPQSSEVHHVLKGPSGQILPELVKAVWG